MKTSLHSLALGFPLTLASVSAHAVAAPSESQFAQDVKMRVNFKDQEVTTMIESFCESIAENFHR